jgi:recombination protein RecR
MNPADHLAELFLKFPGIGPKQAKRFVYYLLRADARYKDDIIRTIEAIKSTGKQCVECYRYFSEVRATPESRCTICRDETRDHSTIIVVEKEFDIDAIEKTGVYRGVYFTLGGLVPILADKPSDSIRIRELVSILHDKVSSKVLKEIIFAFPVTDTGDETREYVEKTVKQIVGINEVKLSTLARGLSSGLEIEYVDKSTFNSAFDRRQ